MKKLVLLTTIFCFCVSAGQIQFYKIFYHDTGHYSAMVKQAGDKIKITHYYIGGLNEDPAEFKFDVKPDQQGWIDTDYYWSSWSGGKYSYFIVHLHNPNELNGAGWTEKVGKTIRHGTTTPLE